jgi:hypothetical protein
VPASPIEALSIGILSGVPVLLWGTKTYRRFLGSAGAGTFSRYNPNRAIVSSIVSAGGDVLSKSLSIFFLTNLVIKRFINVHTKMENIHITKKKLFIFQEYINVLLWRKHTFSEWIAK